MVLTILFATMIGLIFVAYSGNTHIMKTRYDLTFSNLPKGFDNYKIVQISDLHVKEFGKDNARLLKAVAKEDPDLVVTTGDMINSTDTPDKFDMPAKLLSDLASLYDTYYIDGNHETAMNSINSDYYHEWIALVKDSGTKILDNESVRLKKSGDSITLYGLWYNGRYYNNMGDSEAEKYFLDVTDVDKLLDSPSPDDFNILLTHNPVYFDAYSDWGADLTLTGHMHGGVIRVPFKGGLISPERVYWPEYDAGQFEKDDSIMIVNRGLGNGTSGYRFLNWPDVSVITLKAS